jgi:phosphoglycolate phosphatase
LYRLAIFDFDGTLVDSAPGIVEIMKLVIDELQLPADLLDKWRPLVGVPLPRQVETLFPGKDATYHEEIVKHYRTLYDGNNIQNCPLFPGITEVLEGLKNAEITISIASSKRRHLVLGVLDHHDLSKYFSLVIGAQEVTNHKPHPESVHITLSHLDVSAAEAIVIGDSFFDLEMARLAGVDAIGITTGVHTRETLIQAKPKHIVTSLEQVLPVILNGRKGEPGKF